VVCSGSGEVCSARPAAQAGSPHERLLARSRPTLCEVTSLLRVHSSSSRRVLEELLEPLGRLREDEVHHDVREDREQASSLSIASPGSRAARSTTALGLWPRCTRDDSRGRAPPGFFSTLDTSVASKPSPPDQSVTKPSERVFFGRLGEVVEGVDVTARMRRTRSPSGHDGARGVELGVPALLADDGLEPLARRVAASARRRPVGDVRTRAGAPCRCISDRCGSPS